MADELLCTVSDVISDVRTILLDQTQPYRYEDDELISALNVMLVEARRLRPDLFFKLRGQVPQFTSISGQDIGVEPIFRLAFVYGTCAHALLRDDEDIQDQRANAFLGKFEYMLTGVRQPAAPIQGGTPAPANPQR